MVTNGASLAIASANAHIHPPGLFILVCVESPRWILVDIRIFVFTDDKIAVQQLHDVRTRSHRDTYVCEPSAKVPLTCVDGGS